MSYWHCTPGVARSAFRMDREPTSEERSHLQSMGLQPCSPGERYRHTVRCPVNGDGYWYTRQWLLDDAGETVGSFIVPGGDFGEI